MSDDDSLEEPIDSVSLELLHNIGADRDLCDTIATTNEARIFSFEGYAVKTVRSARYNTDAGATAIEVACWIKAAAAHSPHIPVICGCAYSSSGYVFAYPFIEDIDPRDEEEKMLLIFGILRAVEALREQNILHRDIKRGNIMFNGKRALLIDFGHATEAGSERQAAYAGTEGFRAPEVCRVEEDGYARYSFPADVWSAGVVLGDMLYEDDGYDLLSHEDQREFAENGIPPGNQRTLLLGLLQLNAENRLSAQQALLSAWFAGAEEVERRHERHEPRWDTIWAPVRRLNLNLTPNDSKLAGPE